MELTLLYFAWLRERTGQAEERVVVPASVTTVADLIAWLRARSPGYDAAFANQRLVRCAVNQAFAAPDTALKSGDEIAFFPPVTGG